MDVFSRIDELGRPVWIAIMVLGFIWWWPLGLAMVAFLASTGRFRRMRAGRWYNMQQQQAEAKPWGVWGGGCGGASRFRAQPSGNKAFDDYREETLRRLEEEQKEFHEYLERLRQARDKAEFDQFMSERRRVAPTEPGQV